MVHVIYRAQEVSGGSCFCGWDVTTIFTTDIYAARASSSVSHTMLDVSVFCWS